MSPTTTWRYAIQTPRRLRIRKKYDSPTEPNGDKTPATEELRTATEPTPDATMPLPSTFIGCSTNHDPRPTQRARDQDTTPIRASVVAEKMAEKGTVDQGKFKSELTGLTVKKNKVSFQPGADPRRSGRIRDARRTEKLGGSNLFDLVSRS